MNRRYRLLWNDASQRCIPVPETARSRSAGPLALTPLVLLLGALLTPAAQALPKAPQVMAGQADIRVDGKQMTITQTTPKAIVHWQGFDIGRDSKVHFDQRSGAGSIALNRVVAGPASKINGQLTANGQVWLVNPNGVVFGPKSKVDVGGLVASTLDITNEDFGADRQLFTRGAAQGGITNLGKITVADGATLALLAPTVKNEGTLSARLGNVVLAGGDQVTLVAGVDGRLQVGVSPATVRTLIDNKKLIMADGGQVVMTASAADALSASMVSNTGTVQARTLENRQGRILLLGDIRHGEAEHGGMLDASAPQGGHGGFVNTFAARLRIKEGARITTQASHGNTGSWESIGTTNLVIHAGNPPEGASGIAAEALTASLAHTNVDLHAQAPYGQKRHIQVNAGIRHERHRLTLHADHDIDINARVSVEGTGTLHLNYGGTTGSAAAVAAAGSNLNVPRQGQVDFAQSGTGLLSVNGHGVEVIGDLAALQSMGHESRLAGRYALGRSLDARGVDFAPLGNDAKAFRGSFDGLGHTLRNLTIERAGLNSVGMFGRTLNATLRNVQLVGGRVTGKDHVGGLVGLHQALGGTASISHVHAAVQVTGERAVGGLAGWNLAQDGTARLADISARGQVRGKYGVGGLVGVNQAIAGSASIRHGGAHAHVSGQSRIGGLVGRNEVTSSPGTIDVAGVLVTGQATGIERVGELIGDNQMGEGGISTLSNVQYWPALGIPGLRRN